MFAVQGLNLPTYLADVNFNAEELGVCLRVTSIAEKSSLKSHVSVSVQSAGEPWGGFM